MLLSCVKAKRKTKRSCAVYLCARLFYWTRESLMLS